MTEFLQLFLSYGFLVTIFVVIVLFPLLFFGAGMAQPKAFVFLYLSILFLFTSSTSWGVENPGAIFNIYSRGTGIFFFSFVNMYLYGLALATTASSGFNRTPLPHYNLRLWFWLFNLMFFGHIAVAIFESAYNIDNISIFSAIDSNGVINVLNMTLFVYVLLHALRNEGDDVRLADWLMFCVFARGLWLLFRFMFLGGDPANIYANDQDLSIRITSFDINDSLLATMAAYYGGWRLVEEWRTLLTGRKLFYLATVVIALLVIVLSYRRSAWGGLILAGALFVWLQPWRRKLQFTFAGLFFGIPAMIVLAERRFAKVTQGGFLERVFPDVFGHGHISVHHGRFTELYYAWLSLKDHWLFGLGTWGQYYAPYWLPSLSFHGGVFDFVHSGFGHVFLKTGAVGLAIFSAMFIAYFAFVLRVRPHIGKGRLALFDAAVAGMLFSLPDLFGGTPIIEYRTMQLLGLVFALPYVIYFIELRSALPAGGKASTQA